MSGFTITPGDGPFGATVDGVDCSTDLAPTIVDRLVAALARHRMLVVEHQRLNETQMARFGRCWGEPILFFNPRDRHGEHPELIRVSNSPSTPESLRDGAMHWHQDSSYEDPPAHVTMLYAVEAPHGRNDTRFADLGAAYDSLPEATKSEIAGLRVVHDRRGGLPELFVDGERRGSGMSVDRGSASPSSPTCVHPLVIRHPISGERALYGISGTPVGIEGLDTAAAVELLQRLKRHALRPEFLHAATATVGSILVWDNLSVMHTATPTEYSDADGERRRLYRISTRAVDFGRGATVGDHG
jgi:taurine dioxygenase